MIKVISFELFLFLCCHFCLAKGTVQCDCWSDLPANAQDELAVRVIENARLGACPMLVSIRPPCSGFDPSFACHEGYFQSPRLALNGFVPANVCVGPTAITNLIYIDIGAMRKAVLPQVRAVERLTYYRPHFPVSNVKTNVIFSYFKRIQKDALVETVDKRMAECADLQRLIADFERRHDAASHWEDALAYKHDDGIVFALRDECGNVSDRQLGVVSLSRREVSEVFYLALGVDFYDEYNRAGVLVRREELATIDTDFGKRLQFFKSHPDECDRVVKERNAKLRSKAEFLR